MRTSTLLFGVAAAAMAVMETPASAQSLDQVRNFDIPSQPIADALITFSRQSNVQVISPSSGASGQRAQAIKGTFTARVAIDRILEGTSLQWRAVDAGSIIVEQRKPGLQDGPKIALAAQPIAPSIPVSAAPEPAAVAAEEEEEIVIQGIRASLDAAAEIKRNSSAIVDAINAEDAGKFPDTNIAESVQRITGVQINRTRGEGRTVNIRGLPDVFTLVTFNGRSLPNAIGASAGNRSFDFSLLASEFIRTLQVYKSPTSDLDEGGLSGVVNVQTPRALDIGKRVFSATAQAVYESNAGKAAPRLSALYADNFADGRLGITLGASYLRRKAETHGSNLNMTVRTERDGTPAGSGPDDLNGNGVIEPDLGVRITQGQFYNIYMEDHERMSALGSIQFEASDALTLWAESLYSKVDVFSLNAENIQNFHSSDRVIGATTETLEDGIPTATTLQVIGLDLRNGGRGEDRNGYIWSNSAGAKFETDRWLLNVEGSHSRSQQTLSNLNFGTVGLPNATFSVSPGDAIPSVTYQDGFETERLNPELFRLLTLNGAFNRRTRDELWNLKLDVRYELGDKGITALSAGAKYQNREQFQDNNQLTVSAARVSELYGGLPPGPIPGSFSAAPFMVPVGPSSGSFLGSYKGDAVFPTHWLSADAQSFIEQFTDEELIAAGNFTNDATGIIDVKERTFAGYVRADFAWARLSGNVGLRAVQTKQSTVGVSPDLTAITIEIDAGLVTRVPPAEPVTVDRSYWDFLPSLNLKYEVTDDLIVRFSANRTMARPNLAQISPTTTANGRTLTIVRNNPDLDPFRADNADATIEWYFADGALLGSAIFYKKIKSLIRNQSTIRSLPVTYLRADGSTLVADLDWTFNELVNGSGVTVKGIELYYQQAFTFLPAPFDGLGTLLNYTYIDNSDPLQLTAASKHNYNVTGYYEKGPVGVRLSYSWRAGFLNSVAELPDLSTEERPFGSLDGSINVKITDRFSATIEAVNILDADESTRFINGLPDTYYDTGRRFFVGVRYAL